jgi:hypothetical protein
MTEIIRRTEVRCDGTDRLALQVSCRAHLTFDTYPADPKIEHELDMSGWLRDVAGDWCPRHWFQSTAAS